MYYELALISVVIAGGYWGWFFVRDPETATYGAMQLGAALLAGLGLIGRHVDARGLGVAGAIGVGAGACLIVLGPLARVQARRCAERERYRLAGWLLDLADLLAPGAGAAEEKAQLAGLRELRTGNVQPAVDRLAARRERAPADARLALDERISALYLTAQRWDEAIAHAEAHLFGADAPAAREPGGNLYFTLRHSLGFAPQIWIELLGAYGHAGNLEQAARMLARLEDACDGAGDGASPLLHRGRLMFLALAGRVDAVEALVARRRAAHMTAASRAYWLGIAHERRGDRDAARAAFTRARARSRGHTRTMMDRAIERVAEAHPIELPPLAAEVVARVEAAPPPVVAAPRRRFVPDATPVLVGAVLAAAAAIALLVGDSSDIGVLVRGGAMVRGLVRAGEWWRLVTNIFVHVGGMHLALNVLGLWFIGKIAEDMFGAARTVAIFALAGVAGSAASFVASPAGVSAGASGAIFGLIGAVFVELTWQRDRHRADWKIGMWGSLAILTVAQIAIGFMYPIIDQWAHGAGLAVGALAGFALSPHARWQRPARHLARAIAAVFALAVAGAAALVATTPLDASLARGPAARVAVGQTSAVVPAGWRAFDGELSDPDHILDVYLEREPITGNLAQATATWLAREQKRAHDQGFDRIAVATDHVVALPPGWEGSELDVSMPQPDPIGGRLHFRVVAVARAIGGDVVFASLYVPETIARDAPAFFTRLLGSVQ